VVAEVTEVTVQLSSPTCGLAMFPAALATCPPAQQQWLLQPGEGLRFEQHNASAAAAAAATTAGWNSILESVHID
jgi:hypothetical protein